jgi:acid phosphatase type 7
MRNDNKGFSVVESLVVICVLAGIAFVGFQLYNSERTAKSSQNNIDTAATSSVETYKRIAAIGDIVCDPSDVYANSNGSNYCQDKAVAQQIKDIKPDALLLLGDLQYDNGTQEKFTNTFSKNWQQFKSISYPSPGNHEYGTKDASGYYEFFKDAPLDVSKGYYSFKLGAWQIISLNSNCNNIGGCSRDKEQVGWLEKELESNKTKCTLAFWHHPRFTSGKYSDNAEMSNSSDTMWASLLQHKTEVVLNGHDHLYERFQKQTDAGEPSETGIRQFTVGTGGKSHYTHTTTSKNSEKIIDDQFGVLVMDLYPSRYTWQFRNISGEILDSGNEKCH